MKPTAKAYVTPCESGEMSEEKQAVVDRYRKQQAAIDRAEQRRAMKSVAECPVAKRGQ